MSWADLPPFVEKYNFGQTLGKGSFSIVKVAFNTETKEKFAVKIILKGNMKTPAEIERFEREVKVILKMDHPGIIKIVDFISDPNFFFLVMEFCGGGTLLSQTSVPGKVNEEFAKPIFKQILETIKHIHECGVAHRDLKLENIMLDECGHIKIIDFGFSRFANPGQMFQTPCGSPAYAAPEVIGGHAYNGLAADMWSCGVILFSLVTGELPWRGNNQVHIFKQIESGDISFPPGMSEMCCDLIKQLINPCSDSRLTAAEALSHPWLEGIVVSWGQTMKLKPVISEKTFIARLTSLDDMTGALSPRSVLKQLSKESGRTSKYQSGIKSNGCFSFGPKTPAPLGHQIPKIVGNIRPLKEGFS